MMPNYNKESVRPLQWPHRMVSLYCVFYKPSSLMSFFSLLWWNPVVNPVQETLNLYLGFTLLSVDIFYFEEPSPLGCDTVLLGK